MSPKKELKPTRAHFRAFSRSEVTSGGKRGQVLATLGMEFQDDILSQTVARPGAPSQSFQAAPSCSSASQEAMHLCCLFSFIVLWALVSLQHPYPSPCDTRTTGDSGDDQQAISLVCLWISEWLCCWIQT